MLVFLKSHIGISVLAVLALAASVFFVFDTKSNITNLMAPAPVQLTAELPVRLRIPSIDVDAAVQIVGLAEDGSGAMDVPDNFTDVGWYEYGPRPGMPGSAVIAGHLNGKDVPQAVFYDLSKVEVGDLVEVVGEDGVVLTFAVVDIRTYEHDDSTEEVFISDDGQIRLNLITCAGEWLGDERLYDQRTVLFTELVN